MKVGEILRGRHGQYKVQEVLLDDRVRVRYLDGDWAGREVEMGIDTALQMQFNIRAERGELVEFVDRPYPGKSSISTCLRGREDYQLLAVILARGTLKVKCNERYLSTLTQWYEQVTKEDLPEEFVYVHPSYWTGTKAIKAYLPNRLEGLIPEEIRSSLSQANGIIEVCYTKVFQEFIELLGLRLGRATLEQAESVMQRVPVQFQELVRGKYQEALEI